MSNSKYAWYSAKTVIPGVGETTVLIRFPAEAEEPLSTIARARQEVLLQLCDLRAGSPDENPFARLPADEILSSD